MIIFPFSRHCIFLYFRKSLIVKVHNHFSCNCINSKPGRHTSNAPSTRKQKRHEYFLIKHRPFPSMLLSDQQETLWLQWMQIVDIVDPKKSFLHAKILHGVFQANYLYFPRKILDIWKKLNK